MNEMSASTATTASHTFIIAEAGVNHNGDPALAFKLVDAAVEAGADAVKFQTFRTELEVKKGTPLVEYQSRGTEFTDMFEMVKALELAPETFIELKKYCDKRGIRFMSTGFDLPSIQLLVKQIGIDVIKVPSGEMDNVQLLRACADSGLPVLMSTGMCTLDEVAFAIDVFKQRWAKLGVAPDLTLLHCTTAYPTPPEEVHLRSMLTLAEHFKLPVGLSDHSEGSTAAIAAVAMGAVAIEKHMTLDRGMSGPDHAASLDPKQMAEMVAGIRAVEQMLGSPVKELRAIERDTVQLVRRSFYASRAIAAGETITEAMLVPMRPQSGIPAGALDQVVGRKLARACAEGDVLQWDMLA
jgi:N-acetylneuraminate synthase/N,N'-diacetyllegionaminate synthase